MRKRSIYNVVGKLKGHMGSKQKDLFILKPTENHLFVQAIKYSQITDLRDSFRSKVRQCTTIRLLQKKQFKASEYFNLSIKSLHIPPD
jgi:hypothetical protein